MPDGLLSAARRSLFVRVIQPWCSGVRSMRIGNNDDDVLPRECGLSTRPGTLCLRWDDVAGVGMCLHGASNAGHAFKHV